MNMTMKVLKETAKKHKKLILGIMFVLLIIFPQVTSGMVTRVGSTILIYSVCSIRAWRHSTAWVLTHPHCWR